MSQFKQRVGLAIAFALALTITPATADPPPNGPRVVSETDDMNDDSVDDTVIADPSGGGGGEPGTVEVVSGENEQDVIIISGNEDNDKFGYAASTACDVNGDGVKDLLVGAPKEAEARGRAYVFFGPFDDDGNLTADDADLTLQSPDEDTFFFGQVVECVPDTNGDGFLEIMVEARVGSIESEITRAYIFSGATGQPIGGGGAAGGPEGGGGLPPCFGDIAGLLGPDGRVDVNDLLVLLGAWGACPAPPTACPADLNGDGNVDVNDMLIMIGAWGDCDHDGDGMPDYWEVFYGLDPYSDDGDDDADDDGVSNLEEFNLAANPISQDSDGDGAPDGQEVNQGTNPADPSDNGQPDPSQVVYLRITLGDPGNDHCNSSSHLTDLWEIRIGSRVMIAGPGDPGNPASNMTFFCSPTWGGQGELYRGVWFTPQLIPVLKGRTYPITIHHRGTWWPSGIPDYDYEAWVYVLPPPVPPPPGEPTGFPPHVMEDPMHLLGQYWGEDCNCNPAAGKTAWLHVPRINIEARTIEGNQPLGELGEGQEVSPGAFLPLNNDDDDYDANNAGDHTQTGAIAGENDLLPVVLHAIEPVSLGGTYTLLIPGHVRVWRTADRSDANPVVSSTDSFPAGQDTTVYVEGIFEWPGIQLAVNWNPPGNAYFHYVDGVNLTVFTWRGPLNVPGWSAYNYTVTGAPAGAGWTDTIFGGTYQAGQNTPNATILWGPGETVSLAVFQVNSMYRWDLDVNVVRVQVSSTTGTNITYTDLATQNPNNLLLVSSAPPGIWSFDAQVLVTRIAGPTDAAGVMRGIRHIDMGFIQLSRDFVVHGDFEMENTPDPNDAFSSVSNLEGMPFVLDMLPGAGGAYQAPWSNPLDPGEYYAPGQVNQAITNTTFRLADAPSSMAVNALMKNHPISGISDNVDWVAASAHFQTYFVVHTNQNINGSADVYTQRAAASWFFVINGTMDAQGVWDSQVPANTHGSAFTFINDGTVVALPTAWILNTSTGPLTIPADEAHNDLLPTPPQEWTP